MNKQKLDKYALQLAAAGAFAVAAFQVSTGWSVHVWLLFDVILISFVSGELLQGFLVKRMQALNQETKERYGRPLVGKFVLFEGYLLGILVAGEVGILTSDVILLPSGEDTYHAVLYTLEAMVFVVFAFLSKYYPSFFRRRRKLPL